MKPVILCLSVLLIAVLMQNASFAGLVQVAKDQFSPQAVYESFEEPIDWSNAQYRVVGDPSRGVLPGSSTIYLFQSGVMLTVPIPNNPGTDKPEVDIFPAKLSSFGLASYGSITADKVPDGSHYLIEAGQLNYGYELTLPFPASKAGGYWVMSGQYPGQDIITVYAYGSNGWIGTAYIPAVSAADWKNSFFGFGSLGEPITRIYVQALPYPNARHVAVDQLMFDRDDGLTFDKTSDPWKITVRSGSHEMASDIQLENSLLVESLANTSLNILGHIDGAGKSLTKTGAGSLVISGINGYTGGTVVNEGLLLIASADALPVNSALTITNGTVRLASGLGKAVELSSLSIALPPAPAPPSSVPEPGTLCLLAAACGIFGALLAFRRK